MAITNVNMTSTLGFDSGGANTKPSIETQGIVFTESNVAYKTKDNISDLVLVDTHCISTVKQPFEVSFLGFSELHELHFGDVNIYDDDYIADPGSISFTANWTVLRGSSLGFKENGDFIVNDGTLIRCP